MKSAYPLQHTFAGALLCVLGTFLLLGWATGNEMMVRIVPGSPVVPINTAVLLLLSGACMFVSEKRGAVRHLFRASALALIALPLAILSQHLFQIDLGIDWSEIHAELGDGNAHPGRTAPNACVGFLFAGMAFLLNRNEASQKSYLRINLILSGLVLAIGVLALLGYVLHLEAMYHIATYNRMAAMTAIGMTTLGVGLVSLSSPTESSDSTTASGQARRITQLSATLLTIFALTAGLTGFAILRPSFEESSADNLRNAAKTNAFIVSSELKNGLLMSKSVANRTILKGRISNLEGNPDDRDALQDLRDVGAMFTDSGFSGIQVLNPAGDIIVTEGYLVADQAAVEIPLDGGVLNSSQIATLFWKGGFLLRNEQDITQAGQRIGRVITELPLKDVTEFIVEAQDVGQTHGVLLCGREKNDVVCFPSRFEKTATRFPMFKRGELPAFSVSRALLGEAGSETAADLGGTLVQAGYAPLPEYGLGLVVKRNVDELYAPLKDRLHLLIAALLVFVGIGTVLFRSWVQPLVEQIVSEQRRIKAILNNSNDAFIAVNSDSLISDWNLQAEKTLGWAAKEALGKDLASLIIPQAQREAHAAGFSRFLTTGTGPIISRRIEVTAAHKDGHEIPVELSVTSFHNGVSYGASAFMRDLTEVKAAERQAAEHAQELELARAALVQSQKLEAVGKLTGGIAHDFNNVLQVVQGSLQLLQLENVDNARTEKRILTAMTAVDRGAKLSAHLLAFARKHPLQPKVINFATVMRSMGDILQQALGDTIDVEIITADGLWNTLVDPNQLENVILNLSINARDAMQGEGKLIIEADNAILDEEYVRSDPGLKPGEFVMLAISDTGPGIPQDILEQVYEPFFTTKPEGKGTGLGLSMAHGFIKQSGGHIKIYSEVGHGTTIRAYLPRSTEPEAQSSLKSTGHADGGTETVLVVEDDLAVQATVVDMLTGLGYKVLEANNADDALEVVKEIRSIDLLFTDVIMPGTLHSPELARQAKLLIPNLQVLFTSGYTRNAMIHGGRLDAGVHLLSKPYGRDQLAHKVREVLSAAPKATEGEPSATPATPTQQKAHMKIAVVEDNEDFRTAVSEMLTMMGYNVKSFDSSEAALKHLENGEFNILFTDVSLPGMSGIELASTISKAAPGVKIILATGYGDAATKAADFAFQLLTKPFSIEQLTDCLASA